MTRRSPSNDSKMPDAPIHTLFSRRDTVTPSGFFPFFTIFHKLVMLLAHGWPFVYIKVLRLVNVRNRPHTAQTFLYTGTGVEDPAGRA